jgi:outer membrane protein assembly factor BamE (lipoprotein component of BamABCDE complex)
MIQRARTRGFAAGLGPAAAALVLAVALGACAPQMRFHGYAPSESDLATIAVGRDTRDTVVERLGRPGMGGVLEGSDLFYVQSDWRHSHWRPPTEVDRQVVAISFDRNDRVANIQRFGLQDGEVVVLSSRVTDMGPRPGLLRQVFGVFGQFGVGGVTDPDGARR